tara:strand:- start:6422 stop:7033 length:612 start_codon:yes stop_codon:yes gene_type:complete
MACSLTRGKNVQCKDQLGGLKKVFFVENYCSDIRAKATFNSDADQMDTAGFANWDVASGAGIVTVYQYDLRPNLSSMTINVTSDPATGSTFFEQTLNLQLQRLSVRDTMEVKLLAYNRAQIFVQDQNDNVFLLGMDNGCDVSGGTVVTGVARGDMSGYTLDFTAQEKEACIWLPAPGAVGTAKFPFDGLSDESALTITTGVDS